MPNQFGFSPEANLDDLMQDTKANASSLDRSGGDIELESGRLFKERIEQQASLIAQQANARYATRPTKAVSSHLPLNPVIK